MAFELMDLLGGKKLWFGSKPKQMQRLMPQQQQLMDSVLQQALSRLGSNQFDFAPIEQQARTGFQTKTLPGIAERFTAFGPGAQRSSAFSEALGQAGTGLEENLAAMRSNYGMQQQGNLLNLLQMGLQPQFDWTTGGGGGGGQILMTLAKLLPMFL